ncbi:glycosyltransferase [Nocardia sp. NPDC050408]|uniref:glycosyltransferase n=1 Tax=Nocardia sp. NPDC050408 TaxID=3364319 RepID=UPI0037BC5D87
MFVATPLIGHLFPMMPLALHLRAEGHRVLVATGGDAATAVSSDVPVVDVAPRIGHIRAVAQGLGLHPVLALRSAAGMADARGGAHVFAVTNKPMIDKLIRVAARFAPDIVVHEPFASAAAIAAAHLGVPTVLHNIALDDGTVIRRELLRLLGGADIPASTATLSIAPPSIVSVPGWPLRYIPYSTPGASTPRFLLDSPRRPRIVVTRSTMLGDGPDAMLRSVLRAAPDVDADIVIVRPNRTVMRATNLPGNVRTVGWIALHAVLPTCTAMVNHGGAGSVYAALRAGIPQLATPAPGDRRWNAVSVHRRGAGIAVLGRTITAAHLHTLITDARLADAARAVAAEVATMPAIDEVAAQVLALGNNRPPLRHS